MNLQDNNCKQQEALEETPEAHIDVEYLIEEDPPNNCDQEEDPFAVNEIPEQVPDYPKASNLSKYIEGFITDDSTWDTAGLPEESDEEAEVKLLAQGLNEKLNMCRDMLKGMQTCMAPRESSVSQRVAAEVGDVMDVDHA
ncbi:uncharacterized protein LOC129724447 isoform X2 [Wyeomyia smithii]|uniref:uncharacterized protein LOC129724447 isoform X2 n=1 Tax=Wyeomyia smithii TaxID=174621 RepID=UPI002468009A|nr:uncharacterized protein LOC129724447 isoform X2 [Wyeomyia smithii]